MGQQKSYGPDACLNYPKLSGTPCWLLPGEDRMHWWSGSYCKGKEHPPRSSGRSTCCSMMSGKSSARVSPRGLLSSFILFWWRELSEPLARFSFACTAKKPWYSPQSHISVLVTAGTGTHCHLCHLLGHWVFSDYRYRLSKSSLLIAASQGPAQDSSSSYHRWRTQREAIVCLKMASVWRR